MGVIFTKSKKEKVIIKLYNSFYEKENLIHDYKFNNDVADAIIVTKKGIFLFKIFLNESELTKFSLKDSLWVVDQNLSIENPIKILNSIKYHILELLNDSSLPVFVCPVFKKLDSDSEDLIFTVKGFRNFIEKLPQILNNDEINEFTKIIKEDNQK